MLAVMLCGIQVLGLLHTTYSVIFSSTEVRQQLCVFTSVFIYSYPSHASRFFSHFMIPSKKPQTVTHRVSPPSPRTMWFGVAFSVVIPEAVGSAVHAFDGVSEMKSFIVSWLRKPSCGSVYVETSRIGPI